MLIQKQLRQRGMFLAPHEVRIKTPTATRRIDLATWLCNYEVKKWLTRDEIFHAVAQTELYNHYGPKLLWIIPKRRVIVGLAPISPREYEAARKVAEDFRAMGVSVIFVNETGLALNSPELKTLVGILALIFCSVTMLSFLLVQAL
ncbi:hypothetical protein H6F61_26515 [Cyanobacteria bacterium FACHB-472]|nr:hypothetical protein [Cyanobacteria bacterium FACHB-472]